MTKLKQKGIFKAAHNPESEIQLSNPFAQDFEQYIVLNALTWQTRALVQLESVLPPEDYRTLEAELLASRPGMAYSSKTFHDIVQPYTQNWVVEAGTGKGQHLVLCGAGPTLKEHIAEYAPRADQIWGCNSAVTWLAKEGYNPTHAFTVDQTPHMYLEWRDAPDDIEYMVSTTIHPHLAQWLVDTGRQFRYFNNFVGIKKPPVSWPDHTGKERTMSYEEWMYALMFPGTIQAGSGLNTVTRALDVAAHMDFEKITVLGADCAIQANGKPRRSWAMGSKPHLKWLKKNTVMHVDGGSALASEATPMVMEATIDGRDWFSKPDMAISAVWLLKMARASGGKIELIGDTLPNALKDKDEAFLSRLPRLADSAGREMKIPF